MAFDFPLTDGLDNGHTVQNTERGVYYSWNADRSKWIVTGTTREESLGSSVWVGDNPPDPAKIGDLWYNTEDDDLTLYIYTGSEWVSASPPVSLDGIESSLFELSKEISEVNNRVSSVDLELQQEVAYKAGDRANNLFEGNNEFLEPVVVAPGTKGNEAITYEQLANLAGEIDEIKDEKEKGEWKAEIPSTGSEGGREVLVNAEGFPEAQGGQNMMQLKETGGADGFGQLSILIDPGAQDAENQALQTWLKSAAAECTADPDAFKDKYSFYCPQAEELGFAVRDQPIHSIEDPGLTTFKVKFYGKPNSGEKDESIVGVEFFQEGAEGHRPASGKFFMEAYQDKSAQEEACNDAYTNCLTGDPTQDSKCLRDLNACLDNAEDGFKPVSDFGEATAIIFNKTDCKKPAVIHSFDEVRIGDSINITDKATGHFIVAEIDAIQQVGDHIRFTIDTVSHSGGIIEGNKCAVDFYNFELTPGGPDLENYVKKTGDTMSAELIIDQSSGSALTLKQDGIKTLQFLTDGTATTEKTTFSDKDLVTKTYVDSRTASYTPYGQMQLTVKSVDAAMNLNNGHITGYSSTYSNTFFDHWKVEVKIKADNDKVIYKGDDSITTAGEIPVHGVLKILTEDGSTLLFETLISSIEYVSDETPKYYRLKMFKQQLLYAKTGASVGDVGKVKAYFYVN